MADADSIRAVASSVPEPWTARQIAAAAGTKPAATAHVLDDLLAAEELIAFDGTEQRWYYPEPVTAYLNATGGQPTDEDERAAVDSVRDRLAAWQRSLSISSLDGLLRYHHAARLVASSRLGRGTNVYDRDWDILVVLDTCRTDAFRAVCDRLDGVDGVSELLSVGSQTAEWLCQTFTEDHRDELARTGYVTGNGWVKGVFEDELRPDDDTWFRDLSLPTTWNVADDALGTVVNAWQRDHGTYSREVPWAPHPDPRTVTDHAIALARERPDLDRLVVHYKQPHAPYTVAAERADRTELAAHERAPFEYLADSGDRETVWDAYLTELRAAVESVTTLCRNVEGRVAITADHGEAFGESGEYGHRPAMLHPAVRRVPWATVQAHDEHTRAVDLTIYDEADREVDEQLAALGYR